MGKFKLLLDVVEDIRHLADSLEELVSVIKYNEGGETIEDSKVKGIEKYKELGNDKIITEDKEEIVVEKDEEVGRGKIITEDKEEIVVEKDEKVNRDVEISLEDVRGVLANKSQEGFTDEIRSIIKEYNCEKLSEINPKYYLEILQKVNKLGHK